MQTFIFNGTTCCLENIDNNLIPNYQDEAAIVTAIQNGCLNEGQIVTTLSACSKSLYQLFKSSIPGFGP